MKQKLSNTRRLNFRYSKIIGFLHPRYQLNIMRDILKTVLKPSAFVLMGYMINGSENEAENKK